MNSLIIQGLEIKDFEALLERIVRKCINEILSSTKEVNRPHTNALQKEINVFPEENQETLISRKELSLYLKVSIPTIYAWDKKGILNPIKIGTRIRYLKSDVEKILNQVKPSKTISDYEDRI